jgi:hypothetical protein
MNEELVTVRLLQPYGGDPKNSMLQMPAAKARVLASVGICERLADVPTNALKGYLKDRAVQRRKTARATAEAEHLDGCMRVLDELTEAGLYRGYRA